MKDAREDFAIVRELDLLRLAENFDTSAGDIDLCSAARERL